MSKISPILYVLIACELVLAAALIGWWTAGSPSALQPDLGFLDPVSAQAVRERQARVATGGADAWRDLGEIYVLYGLFTEAEACCRRAAALDPEAFGTYLWWGTALSRLGRTAESSDAFRAAIEHAKGSLADVCRYFIGTNLLREENPREAETAFRAAPEFPPAQYELAKLLFRSDRAAEAIPILDGLIAAHPDREKCLQLRARAARAAGDVDAADSFQERADRASEVLSSDELTGFLVDQIGRHGLDAWVQQAKDLLAAGSPEAASILRKVLDVEFRRDAADLLAPVELSLGRTEEAARILRDAIDREGATPKRLVMHGDAALALGNPEQARASWERAARFRIDQTVQERLARLAAQQGDQTGARQHEALALYAAGIDAERNDDLSTAQHALERAVELDPDMAHAWFHLGECRRLAGGGDAAEAAYRRCLAIDPHHGRAQRSLDRSRSSP
ncbi:MAG: tetratricopeptide repeat protein [Planctomycetaceae bacterium]